jgi:uncharacterized protein (DUF1810 family)
MRRWKLRYGGAVTPVGLRPPFVTAPPQSLILIDAESHLDCRRAVMAQERNWQSFLADIHAREKQHHWIWYIFPQIKGLGHSATSQEYSIEGLEEAALYWKHDLLRFRYLEALGLVSGLSVEPRVFFGSLDLMKFRSSLTLFELASEKNPAIVGLH